MKHMLPIALVLLVAAAALYLTRGRGGDAPTTASPEEEPALAAERSPARLLPPLLPLPEPDAQSARRPARPTGMVGALTFEPGELPAGIELGEPSWLFKANPLVVADGEELAELIAEAFDSALDPRDVRRLAFWFYEGKSELVVYALEFRKPGLTEVAARAFTPEDEEGALEFVTGETRLVLVGGEQRDANFMEMVALVRERVE